MNVQRINELADIIEALPDSSFDMTRFTDNECGTPLCIGGWAVWHFDRKNFAVGHIEHKAAKVLGLNLEQHGIFYPDCLFHSVSKHDAAATLRHLAETGDVKWN